MPILIDWPTSAILMVSWSTAMRMCKTVCAKQITEREVSMHEQREVIVDDELRRLLVDRVQGGRLLPPRVAVIIDLDSHATYWGREVEGCRRVPGGIAMDTRCPDARESSPMTFVLPDNRWKVNGRPLLISGVGVLKPLRDRSSGVGFVEWHRPPSTHL